MINPIIFTISQKESIRLFIKDWLLSLMISNPKNSLVDKNFLFENGLYLKEYIESEKNEFVSLSDKYDLTNDFDIIIDDIIPTSIKSHSNRFQVFYTVINHLGKRIFKWYLTITFDSNHNILITSNDYFSQIVHKFRLSIPLHSLENINNQYDYSQYVNGINLAIKTEQNFLLKNIFHPSLLLDQEHFQNQLQQHHLNSWIYIYFNINEFSNNLDKFFKLHYVLLNENITLSELSTLESRKLPLNIKNFKFNPPFEFYDNHIITKDSEYPFNLYINFRNGNDKQINHPRNVNILLNKDIESITITDSLDNDWIIHND